MDIFTPDALIALLTLFAMEVVLGIDNIIFISILTSKLPEASQAKVRNIGIGGAVVMRVALLFSISWIMGLTEPLFSVFNRDMTGRSIILILGGLFLIAKATFEIHERLEGEDQNPHNAPKVAASAAGHIIFQILLLDIVFSLDSVITAVGMVSNLTIMVIAMLGATLVMLLSAGHVSRFVQKHPTIKILALSFLILIGVTLVVEGMGGHVGKGYIYFSMAFSLAVELLNMRFRSKTKPVELRGPNA